MHQAVKDRIEVALPTRFRALGKSGSGEIKNVSPGGMFISTPATFEVGDKIDVSFREPWGDPIEAHGVVWWITKDVQFCGMPIQGFGVRLADAGQSYRRLLARLQKKGRSARK